MEGGEQEEEEVANPQAVVELAIAIAVAAARERWRRRPLWSPRESSGGDASTRVSFCPGWRRSCWIHTWVGGYWVRFEPSPVQPNAHLCLGGEVTPTRSRSPVRQGFSSNTRQYTFFQTKPMGPSIFSYRELTRLHLGACDIPVAPLGSPGSRI
jgi:hypothetical protein